MLGILTYCVAAFIELHLLNAICLNAMQQFQHCGDILHGNFLLDLPFEYRKSVSSHIKSNLKSYRQFVDEIYIEFHFRLICF